MAAAPNGYKEMEEVVAATWKPFEYENSGNVSVQQKITITKGMKNLTSTKRTIEATHSIGASVEAGDPFEIVSVTASYSFSHKQSEETMTQKEIYESQTIEHTVTIPPHSRFTRWSLDADVGGAIIQGMHLIDVVDDIHTNTPRIPQAMTSRSRIIVPQLIHFGKTVVRLKHSERNEYMTVVNRKNWPAATLGHSNLFHFLLCEDSRGIRIKTLNTMHSGYEWAYSSEQGGIYFDLDQRIGDADNGDVNKQHWSISKAAPFHHGDVVTFKNKHFNNSGLCYHDGPATNIYCLEQREDTWVLEVVRQG
jgi:hypothetical protein